MPFDAYFSYFIQWFNYSMACAALPISTHGCAQFWFVAYFCAVCLCLLVFLYALRNVIRDKAAFKAYQKRKIAREKVADVETMQKVRWQPNDSFDALAQSELAEKMRLQLAKDRKSN